MIKKQFVCDFVLLCGALFFVALLFTQVVRSHSSDLPDARTTAVMVDAMQNVMRSYGQLPVAGRRWAIRVPITAYASEVAQTDNTPFTTASGSQVRDGIVAANFLPMGTRVRIPELYGDKDFVVEDRMNARYTYKMDVWMADNNDARRFGVKYAEVYVFEE